jgi:uncharacterized iron-regulated membrane protein
MNAAKTHRRVHRMGALLVALPALIIFTTGALLQLKKDVEWVQPATQVGSGDVPEIAFERILEAAASVPEAGVRSWEDVDRLDVRPGTGIVKLRAKSRWEVQIDTRTAEVLQTAYRRSDLIESIHDGSFFHDRAKLWLFLPTALILVVLWVTGVYLFLLPYLVRRRRRVKARALG